MDLYAVLIVNAVPRHVLYMCTYTLFMYLTCLTCIVVQRVVSRLFFAVCGRSVVKTVSQLFIGLWGEGAWVCIVVCHPAIFTLTVLCMY